MTAITLTSNTTSIEVEQASKQAINNSFMSKHSILIRFSRGFTHSSLEIFKLSRKGGN